MQLIKYFGNMAGFWLGFSVSAFCGFGLNTWEWWAIVLPIAFLHTFKKD